MANIQIGPELIPQGCICSYFSNSDTGEVDWKPSDDCPYDHYPEGSETEAPF